MLAVILRIIIPAFNTFYKKQLSYSEIVKEFRIKLPREQNEAKKAVIENPEILKQSPFLRAITGNKIIVFDTTTHKTGITEKDIDIFYHQLDEISSKLIFFKDYYQNYTRIVKNFQPNAQSGDFHLAALQDFLNEKRPLKPFDVLVYHLKHKYKWSKLIYNRFKKKS